MDKSLFTDLFGTPGGKVKTRGGSPNNIDFSKTSRDTPGWYDDPGHGVGVQISKMIFTET